MIDLVQATMFMSICIYEWNTLCLNGVSDKERRRVGQQQYKGNANLLEFPIDRELSGGERRRDDAAAIAVGDDAALEIDANVELT